MIRVLRHMLFLLSALSPTPSSPLSPLPSLSLSPSSLPPSPLLTELDVPGIPTEDELIAWYKQQSGIDFSERELRYAKTVVCLRFISSFQVSQQKQACITEYITPLHTHQPIWTTSNFVAIAMRGQCSCTHRCAHMHVHTHMTQAHTLHNHSCLSFLCRVLYIGTPR